MKNSTSEVTRRTQWDSQLLPRSVDETFPTLRNTGRKILQMPDGSTLTALAYGGEKPMLRVWRNLRLLHEYSPGGQPSAPCFTRAEDGWRLWFSVDEERIFTLDEKSEVQAYDKLRGALQDVLNNGDGVLVLHSQGEELFLSSLQNGELESARIDEVTSHATLERGDSGALHLAYEKRQGIEYARYDDLNFSDLQAERRERVCEAFCFHPTLLVDKARVLLAFRGEQCRLPSYKKWADAWERLGRGGYIGAAVLDDEISEWRRFRLADASQCVQRIRMGPSGPYGAGEADLLRARLGEYSPPSLSLASDGVPHVLWANWETRYLYQSRFGGESFSEAIETHGPFEQLQDVLLPKLSTSPSLPFCAITKTRSYFDALALPAREVALAHQTDWLQEDELAQWSGVERALNELTRHTRPVISMGASGDYDDGGVVADIFRENGKWRAETMYLSTQERNENGGLGAWKNDGHAVSDDGIEWKKMPPRPLEKKFVIAGDKVAMYSLRYLRDENEPDAAHRYKGFYRSFEHEPWGWVTITSPDEVHWNPVATETIVRADDDLRVWRDDHDIPARRFKANAIGRSHCGRVAALWSSADAMHWNGERETLDFFEPWNAEPHRGSTGRILLESWAGPSDEDEVHGGYIFREGARYLLHYMKWTPDGHVYLALASSRDGINFSRVCGGRSTLPLGQAGAWDAGRVAIREAPFLIKEPRGAKWRQYYTGCGWKHGLAGVGARTSPVGENAPNQMGAAEIPAGRWTHLQTRRECEMAQIETIIFTLENACSLALDFEAAQNSGLACRVLSADGNIVDGFGYDDCDNPQQDGHRVAVTWCGLGLETLGARELKIGLRWSSPALKLFGLHLQSA